MCGIVGYVGEQRALPILMGKLQLLTYRGYDSAGVAVTENGHFYVEKIKGRVSDLAAILRPDQATGTIWATHAGRPTASPRPPMPTRTWIAPAAW